MPGMRLQALLGPKKSKRLISPARRKTAYSRSESVWSAYADPVANNNENSGVSIQELVSSDQHLAVSSLAGILKTGSTEEIVCPLFHSFSFHDIR